MKKLIKTIRPTIALDFGTANCLIVRTKDEVELNEPTVVAIDIEKKKLIAVGKEAKKMLGKEPKNIVARRPLRNGGISNYKLAYALLSDFLNKSLGRWRIVKPNIVVSVPSKINSIEERALVKALESFGVNKITLFPESFAAALGAKLPIDKPSGSMIVNLGGGTAEIAVLSLGGIVASRSHVGTGDALNEAIIELIKNQHNIAIGEQTAEEIKIKLGDAMNEGNKRTLIISGKDIPTGISKSVLVSSQDIHPAIRDILNKIIVSVRRVFEDSPPELVGDLADRGIAISGGSALLQNIDVFMTKTLGVPCYVVEDPMSCVVRGLRESIKLA